jgi:Tol biopolymer transport system component
LAPGDLNGDYDVFLKNLDTGEIIRVSGIPGPRGPLTSVGLSPVFSSDGQWLAFEGTTLNSEAILIKQVYLRNMNTGQLSLVNSAADGTQGDGFFGSASPMFSPDGQQLAFASDASNLVTGDNNNSYDVFIKHLNTGEIELVSRAADDRLGNGASDAPAFSPDGQRIAFSSTASNLVLGDGNGKTDVFLKNLDTHEIVLVSRAADGTQGNGDSVSPVFSPDGLWLLFSSDASNLAQDDSNAARDIFIKNLNAGDSILLNSATDGAFGNANIIQDSKSDIPLLKKGYLFSPNDSQHPKTQWVAFISKASNLVPNDVNGVADAFVRNLNTGEARFLYSDANGAQANRDNDNPDFTFSPDGQSVVFASSAYNLVPGDVDGVADVFIKNLTTGSIQRIVVGHGEAFDTFGFSPDGEYISYIGGGHLYITPNPYWLS